MQGMLTSLLGNLSLLSYFAKKREKEAMVVQTLGVVSTYVVLVQLALAETMPLPYFLATSVVVASGLFLNFMNFFGLLNAGIWRFWEDFITIGGLSVLPQVIVLSFSRPSINRIRTFYQYLFILLGTDQAYQFTNTFLSCFFNSRARTQLLLILHCLFYNLNTDNVVYICPLCT